MSNKRIVVGVGLVVLMIAGVYFLFPTKPAPDPVSVRIIRRTDRLDDGTYQWTLAVSNRAIRQHMMCIQYLETKSADGRTTNREEKSHLMVNFEPESRKEMTVTSFKGIGSAARVIVSQARTPTKIEQKIRKFFVHSPYLHQRFGPKLITTTSEWFYVTAPKVPTAAKAGIAPNASLDKSENVK